MAFSVLALQSLGGRLAPRTRFFESRGALNRLTGGIKTEIDSIDEGWLVTHTGTQLGNMGVFDKGKIRRLVLLDPEGAYRHLLSPAVRDSTADTMSTNIRDVTRLAIEKGVDVRWVEGPIAGMLIANPEKASGWVRHEVLIPHLPDRIGFMVQKRQHPVLFNELRRAFEELWQRGRKPPSA